MRLTLAGLAVVAAVVVAAPVALASERHPTLQEIEGEVMCPVCPGETLDQSHVPAANQERALIRSLIAGGLTKSQIKRRLVDEYGTDILAAPPRSGFNLLAWWLPIAGAVAGALVLGFLAWRWSRGRREPTAAPDGAPSSNGRAPDLEPELERRLDEELARFDA